jgi:hypothetical protein
MTKLALTVIAGVFAGAFVLELLNSRRPGMLGEMWNNTKRAADDFRSAFVEGYRSAIPSETRAH